MPPTNNVEDLEFRTMSEYLDPSLADITELLKWSKHFVLKEVNWLDGIEAHGILEGEGASGSGAPNENVNSKDLRISRDQYPETDTRRSGPCTARQNNINNEAMRYLKGQIIRAQSVIDIASRYTSETRDMRPLVAAVLDGERNDRNFRYVVCSPTFSELKRLAAKFGRLNQKALSDLSTAITTIYQSANKEFDKLKALGQKVEEGRKEFESSNTGAGGLTTITDAHVKFENQRNLVESFRLVTIQKPDNPHVAEEFYAKVKAVIEKESKNSTITDLDRLRQEYVGKRDRHGRLIRVPKPSEFVNAGGSQRFEFNDLNTGDYQWAILDSTLLFNLDLIADEMDRREFQIQLNSVYRNPARASGGSQHQYGTAVDFQVFDFSGDGGRRGPEDWEILAELVRGFGPSYLEPINDSGEGHVHADWR